MLLCSPCALTDICLLSFIAMAPLLCSPLCTNRHLSVVQQWPLCCVPSCALADICLLSFNILCHLLFAGCRESVCHRGMGSCMKCSWLMHVCGQCGSYHRPSQLNTLCVLQLQSNHYSIDGGVLRIGWCCTLRVCDRNETQLGLCPRRAFMF